MLIQWRNGEKTGEKREKRGKSGASRLSKQKSLQRREPRGSFESMFNLFGGRERRGSECLKGLQVRSNYRMNETSRSIRGFNAFFINVPVDILLTSVRSVHTSFVRPDLDSSNALPDVNNFHCETRFVHDQSKYVSA